MNQNVKITKDHLTNFKNKLKRMDLSPLVIYEDDKGMYATVTTIKRVDYPFVVEYNKSLERTLEVSGLAFNPSGKTIVYSRLGD